MNKKSYRKFLLVWGGQLISAIGSGLTAFSLGVYAYNQTKSAGVYSLIILFAFLPSYLFKPLGGALSDRYDRRLMIMIGDLGSALSLGFILIMFALGIKDLWVIYSGVAASSLFIALQNPAYKASVTDLVEDKFYAKVSGLVQLAEASRFLISPILAAFLMQKMNIGGILMIDISTFLLAIMAVFFIRFMNPVQNRGKTFNGFFSDLAMGFKYAFSDRGLVALLLITSMITFAVGFLQALMGPMILAMADAKTFGTIQTLSATGMIISSLFIGVFSNTRNQVKILSTSLLFSGIFYVLFGSSSNFVFITLSGFLFFMTLPFVNTSLEVLIRQSVDNQFQGRVWSIVSLISQLGMVIAFASAGVLADRVFNPMLAGGGIWAESVGAIIGTGEGRGIGLMFVLAGMMVCSFSFMVRNSIMIKEIQHNSGTTDRVLGC